MEGGRKREKGEVLRDMREGGKEGEGEKER